MSDRVDLRRPDGAGLWTEVSVAGAPLLLISGMGAHLGHWPAAFLDALGSRTLVRYEHRGINRSTTVREPFSVVELADDAAALLDRLGAERVDVLGFSLGGMVAQELALRHPERVGRLVLVGTSAGPAPSIPDEVWARMWAALRGGDADAAIATTWALSVSSAFVADPAAEAWRAAARAGRVRPKVVAWQHDAAAAHDALDRVDALAGRVTVVHGTQDEVIPPERAELLAAVTGASEVTWVPGAGHACFWEAPGHVATAVLDATGGPA